MTSKLKQLNRIDVLCEDRSHHRFIKKYLECNGVEKHKIKPFAKVMSRDSSGVLKYYPECVKKHRSEANHQNIALIVMIDADEKTVGERLRELDKKLDEEKARLNQKTRGDDEKIAIFVPSRNIETWFHYILEHADCNENVDYKINYIKQHDAANNAAKIFAKDVCPHDLPENALPSLHHACNELKRLYSE